MGKTPPNISKHYGVRETLFFTQHAKNKISCTKEKFWLERSKMRLVSNIYKKTVHKIKNQLSSYAAVSCRFQYALLWELKSYRGDQI